MTLLERYWFWRYLPKVCVCGHSQEQHKHWRSGQDCGKCGKAGCRQFRNTNVLWRRVLRKVRGH